MKTHRLTLPKSAKEAFADFFDLFFPCSCVSCHAPLIRGEQQLCTHCNSSLPKTNFHLLNGDSPLELLFWGRVPIHSVWAYLRYTKGGKAQRLLHSLKYQDNQPLGIMLGRWFGYEIKVQLLQKGNVDLIIPVPLHRSKLKSRGYNQSDLIARGLSEGLGLPFSTQVLLRKRATDTQTRKSRMGRWLNVATVFAVDDTTCLQGKHILLVDDVLTTGATLEAAAQPLISSGARVSIAVLAYAR